MSGKRIHLSVVVSTNMHTTDLLSHSGIEPWTVVSADFQTGGKGQRGRVWESEAGENLTFSVVLKPEIKVAEQYLISAAVSLSVIDLLESKGCEGYVKWPNDIIVNDHKIAGLLIENQLKGDKVEYAIAGIGLNVNQVHFNTYRWPATSLKLEKAPQLSFDRELILSELIEFLKVRLVEAEHYGSNLMQSLNEHLYKRGELVWFSNNDEAIQGVIREVTSDGQLLLSERDGLKAYSNGEITVTNTFG
jgi:BirA family transcriptional regulator, biotin operon repressor / biotin---[acetyl-CoA-carboxylase] ligase